MKLYVAQNKQLFMQKFKFRKNKFYCEPCYIDKVCHACNTCGEKILGEWVEEFGLHYHPEHFVCCICKRPFEDKQYYELDGKPYCAEHYSSATSVPCARCGLPAAPARAKRRCCSMLSMRVPWRMGSRRYPRLPRRQYHRRSPLRSR